MRGRKEGKKEGIEDTSRIKFFFLVGSDIKFRFDSFSPLFVKCFASLKFLIDFLSLATRAAATITG